MACPPLPPLPELLRSFKDFRLMINGAILVLIVLFLPRGLWDPLRMRQWWRRRRSASGTGS